MNFGPKSFALALITFGATIAVAALTQQTFAQRFQRPPWPADKPISETNKVAAGVYSFRFRDHRSMFVTTSEGVIVTDPINPRAAPMLMSASPEVIVVSVTTTVSNGSSRKSSRTGTSIVAVVAPATIVTVPNNAV